MTTDKESIIGEWHILEMGMWDSNYFNMEVQAYIKINLNQKENSNLA
jgi:hypothetical protein